MSEIFTDSYLRLLHEKNILLVDQVQRMPVKDRRKLFAIIRKQMPLQHLNFILPGFYGLTLGEFATGHLLHSDNKRKNRVYR